MKGDTTYHSSDIYEAYCDEVDDPLDWEEFREVLGQYNTRAMDRIIEHGETLNLGAYLSTLSVIRIKRSHKNPQPNWGASRKRKKMLEEHPTKHPRGACTPEDSDETCENCENWIIFHDTDWYARFYWRKCESLVPYHTAYRFRATRGDKGNKTKLKELLRRDDLSHMQFRLVDHFDPREEAA